MRKETCSCGRIKERRYAGKCNTCHSAYSKQWKKTHPLTEEQKAKARITRRALEDKKLEGKRQRTPRRGAKPGIKRPLCSWCNAVIENFKKKNFCKPCAAKYNREWRKKNIPSPEQQHRDLVRLKTYYEIKMGRLKRNPCEVCGALKVQAHHDDYNKPFDVRWLCAVHHRQHHDVIRKSHVSSSTNNERCDH